MYDDHSFRPHRPSDDPADDLAEGMHPQDGVPLDHDRELLRGIDACRPDSDDLSAAELFSPELIPLAAEVRSDPRAADLRRRVEQIDAAIVAALRDVPLPLGLESRLLMALGAQQEEVAVPQPADAPAVAATLGAATEDIGAADWPPLTSLTVSSSADTPADGGQEESFAAKTAGRIRLPRLRRRWLVATSVTGLAAAASIFLVAYIVGQVQPKGHNVEMIMDSARTLDEEQQRSGLPWSPMKRAPIRLPISDWIASRPAGWAKVDDLLGRSGVAYDLRGPGGARATLYVLPLDAPLGGPFVGLPSSPGNGMTTQGRTIDVWAEGSLVYVLVVQGEEQMYRGFLREPSPLA